MTARKLFILSLGLLIAATALPAQKSKEREDPNVRSVQGFVLDQHDQGIQGAVVQLKNMKTLQVRSFFAGKNGAYYFHGLSTDADYELKADHQGASSPTRTLSVFDSRKKAVINLKLEPKG